MTRDIPVSEWASEVTACFPGACLRPEIIEPDDPRGYETLRPAQYWGLGELVLLRAGERLRNDPQFVLNAARFCPTAFRHASLAVRSNLDTCVRVIREDYLGQAYQYVDHTLQASPDFLLLVISDVGERGSWTPRQFTAGEGRGGLQKFPFCKAPLAVRECILHDKHLTMRAIATGGASTLLQNYFCCKRGTPSHYQSHAPAVQPKEIEYPSAFLDQEVCDLVCTHEPAAIFDLPDARERFTSSPKFVRQFLQREAPPSSRSMTTLAPGAEVECPVRFNLFQVLWKMLPTEMQNNSEMLREAILQYGNIFPFVNASKEAKRSNPDLAYLALGCAVGKGVNDNESYFSDFGYTCLKAPASMAHPSIRKITWSLPEELKSRQELIRLALQGGSPDKGEAVWCKEASRPYRIATRQTL